MKKLFPVVLIAIFLFTTAFAPIAENGGQRIEIKLNRNFGYGGFGQIQGTFTISADAPDDVVRVEFILNGELMAEDVEAPWKFNFNTDSYEPGDSTFSAKGYTADGTVYTSNTYTTEILSGEDAMSSTFKLVVPILLVVVGVMALSAFIPIITGRKKAFELKKYGLAGGAVCKSCGLPFSRNTLAPNLLVGKLERCPHCGKWQIAARANSAQLEIAENMYLADKQEGNLEISSVEDDDDKLRQMLDDSRFDD